MNCEEIQSRLSLLIDGRLDEKEQALVNQHLEECPVCREYYGRLLKLESMADEFEIGGGEDYWLSQKEAVLDRIEQAESKQVTPIPARRSRDIFYRIAAVAAAVALVASISIFESRQVEPVRSIFYREKPSDKIPTIVSKGKNEAGKGADTMSRHEAAPATEPAADEAVVEGQAEKSRGGPVEESQKSAKIGIPLPMDTAEEGLKEEVVPSKGVIAFDTEIKQKGELSELDKIIAVPEPVAVQVDEFTITEEIAAEEPEAKPREIISEKIRESETVSEKGDIPADKDAVKSPPSQKAADAETEVESDMDKMMLFEPEEEATTPLMEEIGLRLDSESLANSYHIGDVKIGDLEKISGITSQESAEPQIETPLVDVDEPALGVTRASLDPSLFGDFTEEQKQQYVELRKKVDWYDSQYAFVYSPPPEKKAYRAPSFDATSPRERTVRAPETLSDDSLQAIAYSMAEAFHGLGVLTPVKDERTRMVDLMKKLRKRADEKLMAKLDIYIGELENKLD